MSMFPNPKVKSSFAMRGLGLAGLAAIVGCAAFNLVPLLAAAGLGGGAASAFASLFRPGSELLVGGAVFVASAGGLALRARLRRGGTSACEVSRHADASSPDCGTATKRV